MNAELEDIITNNMNLAVKFFDGDVDKARSFVEHGYLLYTDSNNVIYADLEVQHALTLKEIKCQIRDSYQEMMYWFNSYDGES